MPGNLTTEKHQATHNTTISTATAQPTNNNRSSKLLLAQRVSWDVSRGYRTGPSSHGTQWPASSQQITWFLQKPTALMKSQDCLFQKGENLFMGKEQIILVAYLHQCMERCQSQSAQRDVWRFGNLWNKYLIKHATLSNFLQERAEFLLPALNIWCWEFVCDSFTQQNMQNNSFPFFFLKSEGKVFW